jgi:uncharacterized protein YacL (UPF0231 family)
MLDEIIEIMKKKTEIIEDEPKNFKVVYDDIDLPNEEPNKEFNFDLFQGKLLSKNLEQVVVDISVKKRDSREFIEERERKGREEKEEREEREEKTEKREKVQREGSEEELVVKIIKKPKETGIIANIPSVDWKVRGNPIKDLLPEKVAKFDIRVSSYFMNNREKFVEFINRIFERYKKEFKVSEDDITCDSLQNDDIAFSLLNHQKIIRDYLSSTTPYRGLLVYHSLGAGKTASSIATAEGLKDDKKVYILTPASLEKNYREELKKAGDPLYRIHQCWEWVSIVDPKKDKSVENQNTIDTLSTVLNLPTDYIIKNKGAWLVNISKSKDCFGKNIEKSVRKKYSGIPEVELNQKINEKSQSDYQNLNKQINKMIDMKYKFIHYNGLRMSELKKLTENFTINIFDNSAIVIDEAHNFISRIVNKLSKTKSKKKMEEDQPQVQSALSLRLYEMLLSAENSKIILLTGTPIINYPNEIAILFNILRGYIISWELTIHIDRGLMNKKKLEEYLVTNRGIVDYLDFNDSTKVLTITRNPFGFYNKIRGEYQGVEHENNIISNESYIARVKSILRDNNIEVKREKKNYYKALPDTLDEFTNLFIETDTKNIINKELFKRRIIGLTSYFKSEQEKLLPRYEPSENFKVIDIPMSGYQFQLYESARSVERKQEQNQRKQQGKNNVKDLYSEPTSTYRIFSRLFCNFVMPEEIPRPLPKQDVEISGENKEGEEEIIKELNQEDQDFDLDNEREGEIEGDELIDKIGDRTYKDRIRLALRKLKESADIYLSREGLKTYSPKFLEILNNITSEEHIGLHLLYSQFRSMEGIEIFKLVLIENGFAEFKLENIGGQWSIVHNSEDDGKPKFALYTGTEDSEEKELIRLIYNGEWEKVPRNISDELKSISSNNNFGEIIKLLMITASGSEGINLRNTRYVHIMEPYWNPARIDQVVGRARRICSHKNLESRYQTVEAFIYLMKFTIEQVNSENSVSLRMKDLSKNKYDNNGKQEQIPFTSDQALYEISEIKREISEQIITSIKETSIDCQLYQLGSKENLNCLRFGKDGVASNDAFSYTPNIKNENKDLVTEMNKKEEEVNLIKMKYKDTIVYGKDIGRNEENQKIYELFTEGSVKKAREDPTHQLVKLYTILFVTDKSTKQLKKGLKIQLNNGKMYTVT